METEFIPIDYDYFDFNGKNYIQIIGKNNNHKKICLIDSYEPYFWAVLHKDVKQKTIDKLIKEIEKIQLDEKGRATKVEKIELHTKNYLGTSYPCLKIFVTNFKDAHAIADKLGYKEIFKRRGYDLSLITKYIIDKKLLPLNWYKISGEILDISEFGGLANNLDVEQVLKLEKAQKIEKLEKEAFNPKIIAYDLEVDNLEIGKGEILMISLVSENLKKVLTWKKIQNAPEFVETLKDESQLIERFIEIIKKENPDFLTGYFSDGFDLPYLKARAEFYKIKLNLGIDDSIVKFSRGRELSGKIFGIVHIDLLRFIETAYSQYLESETLSLNEVANELLGEKKLDFEIKHSTKLKPENWRNYFEYNLQDSMLTYKLFQKAWPDLLEFSRTMQEPIFDVSRNGMSKNVESYIIHNLENYNEIAEKRPMHEEISERMQREKYEGAFVLQPTPGLYENIAMFDFTSYWPSIIATFNLSKSTILEKKQKNALEVKIDEKKYYFSKKKGFFPLMLEEIIKKRKQFKQEYKDNPSPILKARSNAFKLLANASYGYQGFFGARYYCPEASAATTSISRDFIKKIINKINKAGYKAIYSDTDSIALLLNKNSQSQAIRFLDELNKNLPGIMELELEDFYKRGIWVTKRDGEFGAKKKYALINYENKLKIRGFETVRRDWCRLARDLQSHIIKEILTTGNHESALSYLKQIIKKIKNREIDVRQLIIKTQLKKPISEYKANTPHITAARKMVEQEIPVDIGMLIEYYIAESKNNAKGKSKELVRDRVKLKDEPGNYDIEYYLNHQILPAVENIFRVFNINLQEIADGKRQKKLGEF